MKTINALTTSLCMLALIALPLTGCKDHHDHHDHDHASHAHHDHDGHDHGHPHQPPAAKAAASSQPAPAASHDDSKDHADEIRLTSQAMERWNITLAKAGKQQLAEVFTVPARVSYNLDHVAHVGSLVSGRVSAIHARNGDDVTQGSVLLEITSPELGQVQSDYLQKHAAIAIAESTLHIVTTLHDNARKLHQESQGIALSEVQKREADMLMAQASLDSARHALTAVKNQLMLMGMDDASIARLLETRQIDPKLEVRTPITGRVIQRSVTLGEAVSPDRDALLTIANLDTLWVLADVPERYVGKAARQDAVTIHTPGLPDRTVQGQISHIASELDPATRTLEVRIEISRADALLKPGMFVHADITLGQQDEAALAIPESAVQTIDGQSCVFVPIPGEPFTFQKRVVKLGPQVGRLLPVISGLKEGESFVATGSFILKAELGKAGAGHEH